MILQVGLHPDFFNYDLWDLSWISLIFMIILPSCFLNWGFIPWVVYYHYVLMISKKFHSSSMSWIFLIWIYDFWTIWDKCYELCLSMRNLTTECILICELESQEWVLWCFHEAFDIWNDLINKYIWCRERLCWVDLSRVRNPQDVYDLQMIYIYVLVFMIDPWVDIDWGRFSNTFWAESGRSI